MKLMDKGKSPRREQVGATLRFEKGKPEVTAPRPKRGTWKKAANHQKVTPPAALSVTPELSCQTDLLLGVSALAQNEGDDSLQAAQPPAQPETSQQMASGQSVPKSGFRQQSKQVKPSEHLHHAPQNAETFHTEEKTSLRQTEEFSTVDRKLEQAKATVERQEEKLKRATGRLERQKPIKSSSPVKRAAGFAGRTIHSYIHTKLYEVEYENVGTEGAHRVELVGEAAGSKAVRYTRRQVRTHPLRSVQKAQAKLGKARSNLHFQNTKEEYPELEKNPLARFWRKRQQRKRYQRQARVAAKSGVKTTKGVEGIVARGGELIRRYPGSTASLFLCVLMIFALQSCVSSMAALGNSVVGGIGASTFSAEDVDLLGAEAAYIGLEADLQNRLDNYESTHGYDEYHYDLDEIEHDPYVLLSILSALHDGVWVLADVEADLQALFDRQYILTESVRRETRYDTETRTDDEGNEYEVDVPYSYYICTITLENTNLSHLPVFIMGEAQLSRYALYMAALGNRPDLFPLSGYVDKYITSPPAPHEVPEEYLSDLTFAAMLTEAEKYLGYPYVWGGSRPATSFDCSGFISWIANQCGWDIGRLGATGLYNICTPTRSPRPGDIVFFTGTFDAPGVTHCGLYVGDGWMLHCGDPIQYANLNTSYWQAHFFAYGRLP